MKRYSWFLAALLVFASLSGAVPAAAGETLILRVGHTQNDQGDWHKALEFFKKDLAERTNGTIEVQIFPSETLGSEVDNITSIHQGTAEMVVSGDSMINWAPYAGALGLPYALSGYDAMIKAVESPDIGGVIEKDLIENALLRPIGYFLRSARNLTSNRKIEKYEDMRGLKMRIANNPIHQRLWNAFGASANPMNFSEVFSALQNGTIDAQENPYAQIIAANLNEVQKYLIKTEHVYSWIYVLIGEELWQKLNADQKNAILASGKAMTEFQRQYHLKEVKEQEEYLKKSMEFIEIDKTPFVEEAKNVMRESLEPDLYAIYEKMAAL